MFIPFWILILVSVFLGGIVASICIGASEPPRTGYDVDLVTPFLHAVSWLGILILGLVVMVIHYAWR